LGITPLKMTANAPLIEVEDMIMRERALEMSFEGQVWYDLVRVAKRRNDPNYLIDKVVANTAPERREFVRANLEKGAASWWQLPYNVEAVARNSKLDQKPGF
ncbi:MAG: RagB/SusD family nutrient uptake outer membrane protein, partial [Bacteroidales bacterium]|nr:RagB/SusD family nutrient uptake outer membrane protein [Bacteroidales bacterium]